MQRKTTVSSAELGLVAGLATGIAQWLSMTLLDKPFGAVVELPGAVGLVGVAAAGCYCFAKAGISRIWLRKTGNTIR